MCLDVAEGHAASHQSVQVYGLQHGLRVKRVWGGQLERRAGLVHRRQAAGGAERRGERLSLVAVLRHVHQRAAQGLRRFGADILVGGAHVLQRRQRHAGLHRDPS